jgi:hypothetical protein
VVEFELVELASDDAEFDCVTAPSLPGLSTRTEMFELLGATCVVPEAEVASCELPASWLAVCTPGDEAAAVPTPAASSSANAPRTDAMKFRFILSPLLSRLLHRPRAGAARH